MDLDRGGTLDANEIILGMKNTLEIYLGELEIETFKNYLEYNYKRGLTFP